MNLSSAAKMMGIAFKDFSVTSDKVSESNADTFLEEVLDEAPELRMAYNIAYNLDAEYCNQEFANLLKDAIGEDATTEEFKDRLFHFVIRVYDENTIYLSETIRNFL